MALLSGIFDDLCSGKCFEDGKPLGASQLHEDDAVGEGGGSKGCGFLM